MDFPVYNGQKVEYYSPSAEEASAPPTLDFLLVTNIAFQGIIQII